MTKTRDENDRAVDGTLPDDPEDDAARASGQGATRAHAVACGEPQGACGPDGEAFEPLVSVAGAMAELTARWTRPDVAHPTGLKQLDHLLAGGVRAGDMLALVGAAKGGKSALFGQVLYELARSGVLGVYASVEMPRPQVVSRWVVREAFLEAYRTDPSGKAGAWCIGFSDVLYGKAWRGDGIEDNIIADSVRRRLEAAMDTVGKAGERLFVEHLNPCSTCLDLRSIIERAKKQTGHEGLTVLLLDPIQRLYAHASGEVSGHGLERLNAEETGRVGLVAQQLKVLVDAPALNLAVLFTSDTTKAGAGKTTIDSVTDMRGTYMLNHVATAIFGIAVGTSEQLAEALGNKPDLDGKKPLDADALGKRIDTNMGGHPMAVKLKSKVAHLQCSGNRNGPNDDAAFTFVPGAMTFAESPKLDLNSKAPTLREKSVRGKARR